MFSVSEDIHLYKSLVAYQPVLIDGGGSTTLRVNQGYQVVTLPDLNRFGGGDIAAIQPVFFAEAGSKRALLRMFGPGSEVANMTFDGSITPSGSDVGVARIDVDSDGGINEVLYTVDENGPGDGVRWPIAGGIEANETATIRDNQFYFHGSNAVTVETAVFTNVLNNEIAGGASDQPGFSAEGVFVFGSVHTTVSGNDISGYRNGVGFLYCSSMEISENVLQRNVRGIDLELVGPDFGTNRVLDNDIEDNFVTGITTSQSAYVEMSGNDVSGNAETGIYIVGAGEIDLVDNEVKKNGSGAREHGGILIAEGSAHIRLDSNEASANIGFGVAIATSFANTLDNNELKDNAGAGLVLLGGAGGNTVQFNEVNGNYAGIISGLEDEVWFPSGNTFQGNQVQLNAAVDALDYDPLCNDTWTGNTIGSAVSASLGCIEP